MPLQLYNMLTKTKETFEPLHPGHVGIYVCGPTVYDHPHIGHARSYVSMDVVVRYLRYTGYKVRYVQNITDVGHLIGDTDAGEDRILRRAALEQVEPMELVETYTREYFAMMDALGVTRPDISPRASGHIPEQIEIIKVLIEKGHAYEVNGSVYFDVSSWPGYGKLSGRKVEEQEAGARVSIEEKQDPADFALWKRAEAGHILRWPSPWGWGFPGWHIECTAMSTKYLGQPFDLHGGGVDNLFPHNECEIAQSEAAFGGSFATYWILVGSLLRDGVKMSKSLGNFLTIQDALKEYSPEVVRFYVLSTHYRSPQDYTAEALQSASGGLERLHTAVQLIDEALERASDGDASEATKARVAALEQAFRAAMDDDFNVPGALSTLFEASRETNTMLSGTPGAALSRGDLESWRGLYSRLGGDVLGVIPASFVRGGSDQVAQALDGAVNLLIELRQQFRKSKQFAEADGVRNRLIELGIQLEDTPQGTRWKLSR